MDNSHVYNQFRTQVKPALASKLSEFHLLGYDSVSENELWEFLCKNKVEKNKRRNEVVRGYPRNFHCKSKRLYELCNH
ncbi:hypothetical protein QE429_001731 [Bacillus sp. SORGH_AS 510]|nr:hypothetical protein [Bacillus sp. SORGH_AS_0510]